MKNPTCSKCGSEMRVKTGIYGKFWGCITWPRCDYTKSIPRAPRNSLDYWTDPHWGPDDFDERDPWLEVGW